MSCSTITSMPNFQTSDWQSLDPSTSPTYPQGYSAPEAILPLNTLQQLRSSTLRDPLRNTCSQVKWDGRGVGKAISLQQTGTASSDRQETKKEHSDGRSSRVR
ncbi:hypothetical protein LWI28_021419 [Acer negundo]|uniref:Uncharacterized protein n=1 Tax=Acer negundo TaxID=4023 RepID=A0AAD5IML4_ACENE|nr:hypothetical protein LWI28_021419 [Acer negundo]KAK4842363.1 hypothetical protein QYF36_020194 [Acer negundo]